MIGIEVGGRQRQMAPSLGKTVVMVMVTMSEETIQINGQRI